MVGGHISLNDPNEPSIFINPKNTNEMVAGANLNHCYVSNDGGMTWTHSVLTSDYGVHGDPCITADTLGSFYFFHLANPPGPEWADRIVCQRLDSISGVWSAGSFTGLNGSKLQDKEWACVSPWNNEIYVTWTQFDQYGSTDPNHYSNIRFSRSMDRGETWSPAMIINEVSGDCLDDDNTVEGAVPTVGSNGEIYVSWAGPAGIVFDKSLDGGDTWLAQDIFVSDIPGGWGFHVPGITTNWCNGMPITACDQSYSTHHGNIYINWSDQRNGTHDTDIWLCKSTDGGTTWSSPKRVNKDPPGKHQFLSWMAIDQTTGFIYIIFYDRRAYSDNQTDVYLAVSKDGGETFGNDKISESPFVPNANKFFGDYTNISAHDNVIRPIWARLENTTRSIWTAIIEPNNLTSVQDDPIKLFPLDFDIKSIYPNPFNSSAVIQYCLPRHGQVTVKVFDILGKEQETIFSGINNRGMHLLNWQAEQFSSGVYFVRVEFDGKVKTKKAILSR